MFSSQCHSFSAWSTSFSISCNAVLLAMNYFNFSLCKNVFFNKFLKNIFSRYRILHGQDFFFFLSFVSAVYLWRRTFKKIYATWGFLVSQIGKFSVIIYLDIFLLCFLFFWELQLHAYVIWYSFTDYWGLPCSLTVFFSPDLKVRWYLFICLLFHFLCVLQYAIY